MARTVKLNGGRPYWSTAGRRKGRWVVAMRRGDVLKHVTVPVAGRGQERQAVVAAKRLSWDSEVRPTLFPLGGRR